MERMEDVNIQPMEARKRRHLPEGEGWIYQPSYGGRRVLAYCTPETCELRGGSSVDRTGRYAHIAEALRYFSERVERSFVLDGEIALHDRRSVFYAFDLLHLDGHSLVDMPWTERREALEELFKRRRVEHVEIAETRKRAGKVLMDHARQERWIGIVAKQEEDPYREGGRLGGWVRVTL
jgi:bifunctional non-homologous end joining protein LigD